MFEVKSEHELRALHRAIVSAKFSDDPLDRDVPGSSIVAQLSRRVLDALIGAEVMRKGEGARSSWHEWAALDPSRREWRTALTYAKSLPKQRWDDMSREEREESVRHITAPYILSDSHLAQFVAELEQALEPGPSA